MKNVGLLIVILGAGLLAGCTKTPAEVTPPYSLEVTTAFAQCLTEKGAVFYGTERCPHCKTQKELFGEAMASVTYIDCDRNKLKCQTAAITGYPTRVFADGTRVSGTQKLEALAQKTGCELPTAAE